MTNETTELEPVELPSKQEIVEAISNLDVDIDGVETFVEEFESEWQDASLAHVKDEMRKDATLHQDGEILAYSEWEVKLIINELNDELTHRETFTEIFADEWNPSVTHALKEVGN